MESVLYLVPCCNASERSNKTPDLQLNNKELISACFKFELQPLKRSIALQFYVIDYMQIDVSNELFSIAIASIKKERNKNRHNCLLRCSLLGMT